MRAPRIRLPFGNTPWGIVEMVGTPCPAVSRASLEVLIQWKEYMTSRSFDQIAPADLSQWLASPNGPRLLDVRTPGEYDTMHIPGSYNVPLDLLREHRAEIRHHHLDNDVVLVCRSGQRAAQAHESIGLHNVHVLAGGITAWEASGLPVNRGRARWDLERQVRLVAGAIIVSSIVGSITFPRLKWLAGGVGGGLAAAAVSDTCAMGMLLARLPYNRGPACDARSILTQLADQSDRATAS